MAIPWEKVRGVDFYQPLTLKELGFDLNGESIHYGATRTYEINKVLKLKYKFFFKNPQHATFINESHII